MSKLHEYDRGNLEGELNSLREVKEKLMYETQVPGFFYKLLDREIREVELTLKAGHDPRLEG